MTLPINEIVCGDNVATMQTFPDSCIDLVVTSPPYDNLRTYSADKPMSELWDFEGVAQQLWRVIKPGGVVVWVVADATVNGSETGTSFRQALRFMEIGFRLHDTMIWQKNGQGAVGSTYAYWQDFEYMFVMSSGQPHVWNPIEDRENVAGLVRWHQSGRKGIGGDRKTGRVVQRKQYGRRMNVWACKTGDGKSSERRPSHPATFPESLARDHILSWSNEGDIVLDPFSGSGTTAKMARLMGRNYIGIEINPEYCEIARKRLRQRVLEFSVDTTED